jgi:hypothetical protein
VTSFEYVSVLLSIVIAIALAHLLTAIARMFEHGVVNFSIPLAQWIGFCLFLCVDNWFQVWRLSAQSSWTLVFVLFLLLQASLIFLACYLVVPSSMAEGSLDMTRFFDTSRKKFLGVILVLAVTSEILNLSLPGFGSLHVGLLVLSWIVLLGVGIFSSSSKIQHLLAAINVLFTVYYAVTFIPEL